MKRQATKHYLAKDKASYYLARKLPLEASITKDMKGKEIEKERRNLRKYKSELLNKLEDELDGLLNLIEGSRYSELLDETIKKEWPEFVKELKEIEFARTKFEMAKTVQEKEKPEKILNKLTKNAPKDLLDVNYFKEKVFDEFDEMVRTIFTIERIEKLTRCIFRARPHSEYRFDLKQVIYRTTIAKILLDSITQEYISLLDPNYERLISRDLQNAGNVVNAINRIIKHEIHPIRC